MYGLKSVFSLVLVALLCEVGAQGVTTTSYSNTTSPITTGPKSQASDCCFIVQDTVSEVWWQIYVTSTYYQVVNLTSITTYVTPYPNSTTLSAVTTNVYTTNATFSDINQEGSNPLQNYANLIGGYINETAKSINGSQIVTAGTTVNSPAAFIVYPTLKVITVPAVTDSKGALACATVSSFPTTYTGVSTSVSSRPYSTATNSKTLTETFYTSTGSGLLSLIGTVTTTQTYYVTYTSRVVSSGGPYTSTYSNQPVFTANSNAEAYFNTSLPTKPSATVLSLATPFIWLPSRGATGQVGKNNNLACSQGAGAENYGYPAQAAIDHAASQYPEIKSCLPAGPAIISNTECSAVSPETQEAGGDLTSSTIITVLPTGLEANPTPSPTAPPALPVTSPSAAPNNPPSSQQQQPDTSAAPSPNNPPSAAPNNPPSSQQQQPGTSAAPGPNNPPSSQQQPQQPGTSPAPVPNNPPSSQQQQPGTSPAPIPNNPPSQQAPPANTPATTLPVGGNPAISNSENGVPTLPALPGPLVPGSSTPVVNSPPQQGTTIAIQPPASSVGSAPAGSQGVGSLAQSQGQGQSQGTGQTQAQNGATAINPPPPSPSPDVASAIASIIGVQPIATTPTIVSNLPAIIVSGISTIPLIPGSSAPSGSTTVISGSTAVIVPFQTTIPASQIPSNIAPGSVAPLPSQLPGSVTTVSGTPNVVLGSAGGTTSVPLNSALPGLTGSTTVISGTNGAPPSTYLIVTGATTVPVVTSSGVGGSVGGGGGAGSTARASASASAPLQASSASSVSQPILLRSAISAVILGVGIFVF